MSRIPKLESDMEFVGKLNTRPNLRDGLTDAQMKAAFDAAGKLIQEYINDELIPAIDAQNIPFDGENVEGATVKEALEWLKGQISEMQLGQIGDNTVTAEKLTAAVRNILNSGAPIIRTEAPEQTNEGQDLVAGQLWMKRDSQGNYESLNIYLDGGTWFTFGQTLLPVGSGGTGQTGFASGALLYGTGSGIEGLTAPTEDAILAGSAGRPAWKGKNDAAEMLGFLRRTTVTYVGDYVAATKSGTRTIDLSSNVPSEPVMVYIYRVDGAGVDSASYFENPLLLYQGAEMVDKISGANSKTRIKLFAKEIILSGIGNNPQYLNISGKTYNCIVFY